MRITHRCRHDATHPPRLTPRGAASVLVILLLLCGTVHAVPADESLEEGLIAYREGRFVEARELLEPLAEAGVEGAAVALGRMLHLGEGTSIDDGAAYRYLLGPAKSGNPEAQFLIGSMFLYGDVVPADGADPDVEAVRWIVESAVRGYPDSQYILALLLFAGTGVQQDPDEALLWIHRAAENGHEEAQQFLGHFPD